MEKMIDELNEEWLKENIEPLKREESLKEYINAICKTSKINVEIDNQQANDLYMYMKEVLEYNLIHNLTSITDQKEFVVKHFVDSLTAVNEIKISNAKVLDVGTGAGFPGVVINIAKRDTEVTLIDAVSKKLNCVKNSLEQIPNVTNIEVKHVRAEDFAREEGKRENFDYVFTRAVSNMSTIAEYMLPFLKIGGRAVCMKGPNYLEELEKAKKAIDVLGGTIKEIKRYNIDGQERNNIIIEKIKPTPKQYPRGGNKPILKPIV